MNIIQKLLTDHVGKLESDSKKLKSVHDWVRARRQEALDEHEESIPFPRRHLATHYLADLEVILGIPDSI